MSYDLSIYVKLKHISNKEIVDILNGDGPVEPDEVEWEIIPNSVNEILAKHESDDGVYGDGSITIDVDESVISLNMPYWKDARNEFIKMVRISNEINIHINGFIWDPQLGEILNGDVLARQLKVFDEMTGVVQRQFNSIAKDKMPWWKIW